MFLKPTCDVILSPYAIVLLPARPEAAAWVPVIDRIYGGGTDLKGLVMQLAEQRSDGVVLEGIG